VLLGMRIEVDFGSKGDVNEGVERALRLVEMESSIVPRDMRMKERRASGEKQSEGVRRAWGGGWAIIRGI
jgi:hypothetical protein